MGALWGNSTVKEIRVPGEGLVVLNRVPKRAELKEK